MSPNGESPSGKLSGGEEKEDWERDSPHCCKRESEVFFARCEITQ